MVYITSLRNKRAFSGQLLSSMNQNCFDMTNLMLMVFKCLVSHQNICGTPALGRVEPLYTED